MPQRNIEGQYPYAYQGQEKDAETGMEAFELRLWDARIGRWLTTDPYGQYASPYLGMGNNPISMIDPDGGFTCPTPPCSETSAVDRIANFFSDLFSFPSLFNNEDDVTRSQETKQFVSDTKQNIEQKFIDDVAFVIEGSEVVIKYSSKKTSDFVAPFLEVPQDIIFPIVNQVNIGFNEGIHEGRAYNYDNYIFPYTYQFENWSFVVDKPTTSSGTPSFTEGKDKINNVIDVIPLPINTGKKVVDFTTETLIKEGVKSSVNSVHK